MGPRVSIGTRSNSEHGIDCCNLLVAMNRNSDIVNDAITASLPRQHSVAEDIAHLFDDDRVTHTGLEERAWRSLENARELEGSSDA